MKVTIYLIFVQLCSILPFIYPTFANEPTMSQNDVILKEFSSEQNGEVLKRSWANINVQVDAVIPMVLSHLQNMQIKHLHLPELRESIALTPFGIYKANLILSNGIAYNVEGIQREGNALMTYSEKKFLIRFDLIISNLQFEYDYLLQLMPIEGYGKVIGTLDDTIVHSEMSVDVTNISLRLNKFRIAQFRKIHIHLDNFIGQLTGSILTPITNLFKDRITTSISAGLEKEMGLILENFNDGDPLQLRKFAKQLIAGLTGS
ncbi:uncharacterized protein LOC118748034 [Rhagoletis pomonella]|uniref:uncharacterized protein LOC118748034 n=1 Tax=Rhagoletis pomonella TaxID=28610 RepID=UPI00177FD652|nr:uncharacterized protein LOC118748034 [Rhagoletis pomonella]